MSQAIRPQFHIMVAMSLAGLLFTHEATAGLYQCRTDDGLVYTDTPAQLKQCTPLGQHSGSGSLGLVGGPTTGTTPATAPVLPQPMSPPPLDASPMLPPPPSAPPSETAAPTPCTTGINPLNPLSSPPCPTAEAPLFTPTTVPADSNVLPPAPAQP